MKPVSTEIQKLFFRFLNASFRIDYKDNRIYDGKYYILWPDLLKLLNDVFSIESSIIERYVKYWLEHNERSFDFKEYKETFIIFPKLTRTYASLISHQLVRVQPMSAPNTSLFFITAPVC